MIMFITQVLLRPQNLGNDKALFYGACSRFGVYNPKNLGNDKIANKRTSPFCLETWGVYNPKNLGNDKSVD